MSIRDRRMHLLLLAVLAAAFAVAGCSDDDPTEADTWYYRVEDLENLPAAFEEVYEYLDSPSFTDLLHPDFEMVPTEETLSERGWSAGFVYDKSAMGEVHDRLLGGESGMDASDNFMHPVASIEIETLDDSIVWSAIPPTDEDFGGTDGRWARFDFHAVFFNPSPTHFYEVDQYLDVFAVERTVDDESFWQILGIREAGLPDGTRGYSEFLACYTLEE